MPRRPRNTLRTVMLWVFTVRDKVTGRFKCRWCGEPVPKPRRYYCCHEHYQLFWRKYDWDSVRKRVRKRDGGACRMCEGSGLRLTCHHIISIRHLQRVIGLGFAGSTREYWRAFYAAIFAEWNLKTLCTWCHGKAHRGQKQRLRRDILEDRQSWIDEAFMADFAVFWKFRGRLPPPVQTALREFEAFQTLMTRWAGAVKS